MTGTSSLSAITSNNKDLQNNIQHVYDHAWTTATLNITAAQNLYVTCTLLPKSPIFVQRIRPISRIVDNQS